MNVSSCAPLASAARGAAFVALHVSCMLLHKLLMLLEDLLKVKAVACERAVERSEEHTSELQSQSNLVCRLLLEKKKKDPNSPYPLKHYNPHQLTYLTPPRCHIRSPPLP